MSTATANRVAPDSGSIPDWWTNLMGDFQNVWRRLTGQRLTEPPVGLAANLRTPFCKMQHFQRLASPSISGCGTGYQGSLLHSSGSQSLHAPVPRLFPILFLSEWLNGKGNVSVNICTKQAVCSNANGLDTPVAGARGLHNVGSVHEKSMDLSGRANGRSLAALSMPRMFLAGSNPASLVLSRSRTGARRRRFIAAPGGPLVAGAGG